MRYSIERWIEDFDPFGFCPDGEVLGVYEGLPAVTTREEHCLLPIGHFTEAFPLAVNRQGNVVAGHGRTSMGPSHAIVWRDGIPHDMGEGSAKGVDDRGRVGGNQGERAVRWYPDGSRWTETVESFVHECDFEGNLFGDREDQPCVWSPEGVAKLLPMPGKEWREGFALGQDGRGRVIGTIRQCDSKTEAFGEIHSDLSSADVIWTDGVPEIVHTFKGLWGGFRQIGSDGLILLQWETPTFPFMFGFFDEPALYGPEGLESLSGISTTRFRGNRLRFDDARAVALHDSGRILLEQEGDAVILLPYVST